MKSQEIINQIRQLTEEMYNKYEESANETEGDEAIGELYETPGKAYAGGWNAALSELRNKLLSSFNHEKPNIR